MPWLQLIRWKNLALILLTQLLAWYCIILPYDPQILNVTNFVCLALSTMLIAAAGYVINDYFDIKIDLINKPSKVLLGKVIARKKAILLHATLTVVALFLAGYVAIAGHHLEWLLVQVGCILLLWFYSTHFKRQYLTGNIVVALLAALTVVTLILYEPVFWNVLITAGRSSTPSLPLLSLIVYAFFAFILTWMREIVKDIEDFQGDLAQGCVTMPIKKGIKYSVGFTLTLSFCAIVILSIGACYLFSERHLLLAIYLLFLVIAPLILWCVFLFRSVSVEQFHKASTMLKLIMIPGAFSLVVYYFQLSLNHA
jgi:4-hydroxybenzoate polyprenyltransferase